MDELTNVNEVVEEAAPAEEVFDDGISESDFDAMWADDDSNDEVFAEQATEEEADQPTQEPEQTEETEPTEAEQPSEPDTDQYLELKHFDEVKKVTKDEAKVLAQKGMDYDRIRGKLDEANAVNAKLQKYESFLKELQGDFATIDDLMNDTRARVLSDKEGISYEDAVAKVKAANQQAEQKAQEQAKPQITKEDILEQMRQDSITAFISKYPTVKADTIPKEVWDDMQITNNLVASYERYTQTQAQIQKLKSENETLKKNAENKARSTGSMKSAGKPQKDELDALWYEDDY